MVERLAALPGRRDRDVQVLANAILADVLVERSRPEPGLVLDVLGHAGGGDDAIGHSFMPLIRSRSVSFNACSNPSGGRLA